MFLVNKEIIWNAKIRIVPKIPLYQFDLIDFLIPTTLFVFNIIGKEKNDKNSKQDLISCEMNLEIQAIARKAKTTIISFDFGFIIPHIVMVIKNVGIK